MKSVREQLGWDGLQTLESGGTFSWIVLTIGISFALSAMFIWLPIVLVWGWQGKLRQKYLKWMGVEYDSVPLEVVFSTKVKYRSAGDLNPLQYPTEVNE